MALKTLGINADNFNWCRLLDSNQLHEALQATALPTELRRRNIYFTLKFRNLFFDDTRLFRPLLYLRNTITPASVALFLYLAKQPGGFGLARLS